jgi:cytochrome P450
MTIFLAGHETTANALAWTWYFLAREPDVERRLHREVDEVLAGESGQPRTPTVDDYARLAYTERVFTEAMRLRPPAWAIGRLVKEDYEACDYRIPAGSLILMSQFVMHHDERYYPEPERFDPERWTPEAKATRPPYSYFPFGGGARRCIGESFAWMEGVLVLATLASRWRMRLVPGQRIEMQPLITLRPKHGVRVILEKRNG